ncbi:hypothetical protein OH77DRAFT_350624 [Trametes cingulata]|nr:hypothetical protein OH77DRAFT_350624 [Trametes cingulata]
MLLISAYNTTLSLPPVPRYAKPCSWQMLRKLTSSLATCMCSSYLQPIWRAGSRGLRLMLHRQEARRLCPLRLPSWYACYAVVRTAVTARQARSPYARVRRARRAGVPQGERCPADRCTDDSITAGTSQVNLGSSSEQRRRRFGVWHFDTSSPRSYLPMGVSGLWKPTLRLLRGRSVRTLSVGLSRARLARST